MGYVASIMTVKRDHRMIFSSKGRCRSGNSVMGGDYVGKNLMSTAIAASRQDVHVTGTPAS